MKKRGLTSEDKELWRRVSETTERLQTAPLRPEPQAKRKPMPLPDAVQSKPVRIDPFEIGAKSKKPSQSHQLMPSISERVAAQPVQMDKKAFGKMKRGKLVPESKIDLHGMTLDQAHPALVGFIMRAYADGQRLVLVITGKGKSRDDFGPIPVRRGVLKHQVPQWLTMAPLRQVVMQVTEAHLKHGGSGAYYIYLRRGR
ncbi:MAG: Smr/MutS family protein [Cognatishimia sp.]